MQLDNLFLTGLKGKSFIQNVMKEYFPKGMVLIDERDEENHHGWFILKYKYIEKKYVISFEGEFNSFNIRITTEDEEFISLKQLNDYESGLTKQNIVSAIIILKEILKKSIDFYKIQNGKVYKKNNGIYKRVKDWKEMYK
ncbi:MAG: hypothetical protein HFG28_12525 [Eubacterium sp.]|nr:hypothetical protein [Eubacterium sp.]